MANRTANDDTAYGNYLRSNGPRGFDWRYAAPVAGMAALPALAAIGGGSAAAGAAAAPSAPAAGGYGALFGGNGAFLGGAAPHVATTAARFSLPNILRLAEVGVPAVTGLIGMHAQNKANTRQFAAEQGNYNQQLQFAREQESERKAEAARVAAEEARRWAIDQQNQQRQMAAADEERAFQRRLVEEREARNQQRRMQLADFLRMGR